MRPILYLDVDGVVRPWMHNGGDPSWHPWRTHVFRFYENDKAYHAAFQYSAAMAQALVELEAEIVWATSWCDAANDEVAPLLGWEPLRVAACPLPGMPHHHDWKFEHVRLAVEQEPERPFIWIDDEVCRLRTVQHWASQLKTPHLIVSPDHRSGLSYTDYRGIKRFAKQHRIDMT